MKEFCMRCAWVFLVVCTTGMVVFGAEQDRVTIHPGDNGAALANPGMGWVFHYYDNEPEHYGSRLPASDTLDSWPGLTVIYLRIPWSYIEPEEGQCHWSVLDTPAQRWIAKGKQVAFRITCSESWTRWAAPRWVHDAGAKGCDFRPGTGVEPGGPFWEPDFDDPIFLQKLDRFLAAMAARYDGSPEVAFIDVGSLGVWGEGHTWASTRRPITPATVKRHIDLYKKHFPKTLLVANDDLGGPETTGPSEVMQYAVDQGLTLRDDSILVQPGKRAYFHAGWAQAFWPHTPVILESEHYGNSKARGCWQDGSLYLKAVDDYHASYASIHWWPHEFLEENRELVRKINLRLGYRLQLVEASWPKTVRIGTPLEFIAAWRNAGVAPCLPGGYPAVTLKDSQGGIAAVLVDDSFDVRSLPVAAAGKVESRTRAKSFALPMQLSKGRYDLFVSIGTATGTPRIALPLDGGDGQRQYRLGTIQVAGAAATARPAEVAPRPNVIFILADDLGYGDLGCYGQKKIRTPNLDRMAAEGMRFTNFYCGCSVCSPSRCTLMTGKHLGVYPRKPRMEGLRRLIGLPTNVIAHSLVVVGYPAEQVPPENRYQPERVYRNRWS